MLSRRIRSNTLIKSLNVSRRHLTGWELGLFLISPIYGHHVMKLYEKAPIHLTRMRNWFDKHTLRFHYTSSRIVTRTGNGLEPDKHSIRYIQQQYNDKKFIKDDDSIGVIINVGSYKKGKSFNALMQNVILSAEPCYFDIGFADQHCAAGIDMSPPMPITTKYGDKYKSKFLEYLCIVDTEEYRDDISLNKIKHIMHQLDCVIVLSCWGMINDEDVELCQKLYEDIEMHYNKTPPLIIALTAKMVEDDEKGRNFKKLMELYPDCKVCELPLLMFSRKASDEMRRFPFKSPLLKYIKQTDVKSYISFADVIFDEIRKPKQCKVDNQAIIKMLESLSMDLNLDELSK